MDEAGEDGRGEDGGEGGDRDARAQAAGADGEEETMDDADTIARLQEELDAAEPGAMQAYYRCRAAEGRREEEGRGGGGAAGEAAAARAAEARGAADRALGEWAEGEGGGRRARAGAAVRGGDTIGDGGGVRGHDSPAAFAGTISNAAEGHDRRGYRAEVSCRRSHWRGRAGRIGRKRHRTIVLAPLRRGWLRRGSGRQRG